MTDALVQAMAMQISLAAYPTEVPDEEKGLFMDCMWRGYIKQATAALQAIEAAGYRVVPVEATDRMSEACWRKASDVGNGKLGADQEMWSAMLSAAPRVGEG